MLTTETYLALKEADYKMKDLTGFAPKEVFRRTSQLMESSASKLPLLRIGTVEMEEIFAHLLLSFHYVQREIGREGETIPEFKMLISTIFSYEKILRTYLSGDARSAVLVLTKILELTKEKARADAAISDGSPDEGTEDEVAPSKSKRIYPPYDEDIPLFSTIIAEFDPANEGDSLKKIDEKYKLTENGITKKEITETERFFYNTKGSLYAFDLPAKVIFDTRPTLVDILSEDERIRIAPIRD